jgi:hypothetical protein
MTEVEYNLGKRGKDTRDKPDRWPRVTKQDIFNVSISIMIFTFLITSFANILQLTSIEKLNETYQNKTELLIRSTNLTLHRKIDEMHKKTRGPDTTVVTKRTIHISQNTVTDPTNVTTTATTSATVTATSIPIRRSTPNIVTATTAPVKQPETVITLTTTTNDTTDEESIDRHL